jgi:hypothetical protein
MNSAYVTENRSGNGTKYSLLMLGQGSLKAVPFPIALGGLEISQPMQHVLVGLCFLQWFTCVDFLGDALWNALT